MSVKLFINIVAVSLFFAANAFAQTSAFVYQGKLNDGALAANGTYQFEFKLYDSSAINTGNQIGNTLSNVTATVTDGIFSVNLDFGASSFDGAARYLEIAVRLNNGGQNYTPLNPRQPITATPYAVKSLKANEATTALTANDSLKLGSVPAANFTQNNDARLSDARTPTPFSTYYIQNGTNQQTASNFNISGAGKADILDATTQFNLGGSRFLSAAGANNTFAGVQSGTNNTGSNNSYFGRLAGFANTSGSYNAFAGANAGAANTTGGDNAFFGQAAGFKNTEGVQNTAAGSGAGLNNTTGNSNVFVGQLSGLSNTTETGNTFLGYKANGAAGITNAAAIGANAVVTTSNTMVLGTNAVTVFAPGSFNSANGYKIGGFNVLGGNIAQHNFFSGYQAGESNTTGINNTFVGRSAGFANTTGSANVFVGYNAGRFNLKGAENSFFGTEAGAANTTGSNNAFFGRSAGKANLSGLNNSFFGSNSGEVNTTGNFNAFFGKSSGQANTIGNRNSFFGNNAGFKNIDGDENSFFGYNAGAANTTGFNNTFLGYAGIANTQGFNNIFVGNAGNGNTTGKNNTFVGAGAGSANLTGSSNTAIGAGANFLENNLTFATAIGAGAIAKYSNQIVIGRENGDDTVSVSGDFVAKGQIFSYMGFRTDGDISLDGKLFMASPDQSEGYTAPLCRTPVSGKVVYCDSSSLLYKDNVQNFESGLDLINRLRPVTFDWKKSGRRDLGFVAEEVNAAEPLLSYSNNKGQIEGVNYPQITAALVSGVKEQQTQISDLKDQIKQQIAQIEALKTLICSQNPTAAVCQPEKK